ncbi:methylated-DNA--[protein]-cysteine S-methyltransferase [Microbacterium halophytorum]|uniref:methylated-DNA--[protein]-cysteine S-methyltransferase n=1 Tax=Microbacterium halophytorum TaxID=2067568 RepID=UPI000CFBCFAA|nr:methylated-DNA--[protein]-cysteine S-methyltransferase [Microbacterium halophytorum]
MSTATFETVDTPDGPFTILADGDGSVLASGWTDSAERLLARLRPAHRPAEARPGSTPAPAEAVASYYAGELGAIAAVPVRHHGTELQLRGWATLRRITPGAPLTYAEFAAELGSPSAVRAAASICAKNAPALFTPCHRVLRSDGTLGGFAWGLDVKRALLTREAA